MTNQPDPCGDGACFRRSSVCGDSACVEADTDTDTIRIRSSTDPNLVLGFTKAQWRHFVAGAKAGEFDV